MFRPYNILHSVGHPDGLHLFLLEQTTEKNCGCDYCNSRQFGTEMGVFGGRLQATTMPDQD